MRLIDADALIEVIKKSMAENPHKEETQRAMHIHEHKYFLTLLAGFPTAEPEQRWIPCTERLPEDGRYLVTRFDFVTNTCFLDILWYEKGVWWNRLYTGDFAVTAWTPLPEPYQGGEK